MAAGCQGVLTASITYAEPNTPFAGRNLPTPAVEALSDTRPNQDDAAISDADLPSPSPLHGVDLLIELLRGGEVVPVTIGAMTNLAVALLKEPRLLTEIPRIVCMAACFDRQLSEWNIRCDPVAASIVFNSGIPVTVIGLDVTMRCRLSREAVQTLHESSSPVVRNLSAATRRWAQHSQRNWQQGSPVLHDPLAILALIFPDIVTTRNGVVTVDVAPGPAHGYTFFKPSRAIGESGRFAALDDERRETGPGIHDVAVEVDADRAVQEWLSRVTTL